MRWMKVWLAKLMSKEGRLVNRVGVAQMAECLVWGQEVRGSSPLARTIIGEQGV